MQGIGQRLVGGPAGEDLVDRGTNAGRTRDSEEGDVSRHQQRQNHPDDGTRSSKTLGNFLPPEDGPRRRGLRERTTPFVRRRRV
ncbi:hypothetical protein EYF80_016675 [Liparis tanakae]|uniref:Uncharacterized protein n=1 Tax=Liparis tanakae TaxID=230148 RepID=A0A4Z2I554_9TELE|nr:hypothetical protein EYF80_016675 [Liparis tanakae]